MPNSLLCTVSCLCSVSFAPPDGICVAQRLYLSGAGVDLFSFWSVFFMCGHPNRILWEATRSFSCLNSELEDFESLLSERTKKWRVLTDTHPWLHLYQPPGRSGVCFQSEPPRMQRKWCIKHLQHINAKWNLEFRLQNTHRSAFTI